MIKSKMEEKKYLEHKEAMVKILAFMEMSFLLEW